MKMTFSVFIVLLGFMITVHAEVRPVIYNQPLACRPSSQIPTLSHTGYLRQTDVWLNLRINADTTGQVQNEEQVVVNPLDPDNVVAVWRDFRLGYRRVGVGRSFDGGWNWEDELFFEPTFSKQSDPGLTWHTSGSIYTVVISYNSYTENGLFVSETTDGGLNWGDFVPAVLDTPAYFEDKELIACDRSGSEYDGNLYISWTRFYDEMSTTKINLVRSTTGGASWDAPVIVSDSTTVQWSVPAVGPNGEVYVAWVGYNPAGIYFDKSLDGGVTWGEDTMEQATSFGSAYINPYLLIFAYPAMDVDITEGPFSGLIYIAYTDQDMGSSDTDIFFTFSPDNGESWYEPPIRVNDDEFANGCDQFHPWLICDEGGTLHLIFFDRRNDPEQNLYTDLYYTYSTDAGLSWSPNERITDQSFNPANDSLDSGLIGEYIGLAVRNGVIHPVWTDTRNGHQDVFTAVWDTVSSIPEVQRHPLAGSQIGNLLNISPNPFNSAVRVSLLLPTSGLVDMAVYDIQGRRTAVLAEDMFSAGLLQRIWHPGGSAGVYFIRIQSPAGTTTKKLVYLK